MKIDNLKKLFFGLFIINIAVLFLIASLFVLFHSFLIVLGFILFIVLCVALTYIGITIRKEPEHSKIQLNTVPSTPLSERENAIVQIPDHASPIKEKTISVILDEKIQIQHFFEIPKRKTPVPLTLESLNSDLIQRNFIPFLDDRDIVNFQIATLVSKKYTNSALGTYLKGYDLMPCILALLKNYFFQAYQLSKHKETLIGINQFEKGNTAFYYALKLKVAPKNKGVYFDFIKNLLVSGADIQHLNLKGQTAKQILGEKSFNSLSTALNKKGITIDEEKECKSEIHTTELLKLCRDHNYIAAKKLIFESKNALKLMTEELLMELKISGKHPFQEIYSLIDEILSSLEANQYLSQRHINHFIGKHTLLQWITTLGTSRQLKKILFIAGIDENLKMPKTTSTLFLAVDRDNLDEAYKMFNLLLSNGVIPPEKISAYFDISVNERTERHLFQMSLFTFIISKYPSWINQNHATKKMLNMLHSLLRYEKNGITPSLLSVSLELGFWGSYKHSKNSDEVDVYNSYKKKSIFSFFLDTPIWGIYFKKVRKAIMKSIINAITQKNLTQLTDASKDDHSELNLLDYTLRWQYTDLTTRLITEKGFILKKRPYTLVSYVKQENYFSQQTQSCELSKDLLELKTFSKQITPTTYQIELFKFHNSHRITKERKKEKNKQLHGDRDRIIEYLQTEISTLKIIETALSESKDDSFLVIKKYHDKLLTGSNNLKFVGLILTDMNKKSSFISRLKEGDVLENRQKFLINAQQSVVFIQQLLHEKMWFSSLNKFNKIKFLLEIILKSIDECQNKEQISTEWTTLQESLQNIQDEFSSISTFKIDAEQLKDSQQSITQLCTDYRLKFPLLSGEIRAYLQYLPQATSELFLFDKEVSKINEAFNQDPKIGYEVIDQLCVMQKMTSIYAFQEERLWLLYWMVEKIMAEIGEDWLGTTSPEQQPDLIYSRLYVLFFSFIPDCLAHKDHSRFVKEVTIGSLQEWFHVKTIFREGLGYIAQPYEKPAKITPKAMNCLLFMLNQLNVIDKMLFGSIRLLDEQYSLFKNHLIDIFAYNLKAEKDYPSSEEEKTTSRDRTKIPSISHNQSAYFSTALPQAGFQVPESKNGTSFLINSKLIETDELHL